MYCPLCGAEIRVARGFCPQCGGDLNEAVGEPQELERPVQTGAPTVSEQPAWADSTHSEPPTSQTITSSSSPTNSDMPSAGTSMVLIVVGFLCGVVWGAVGLSQYGALKSAIEMGDVETAKKKASFIRNITIAGVVINLLVIMGAYARSRY